MTSDPHASVPTLKCLSTALDSLLVGLLILDEDDVIREHNQAACTILRVESPLVGRSLSELVLNHEELRRTLTSHEKRTLALRLVGGAVIHVFVTCQCSDGDPSLSVFAFEDLTALQARGRRQFHIQKLALTGEIAARITHEIKNPIAGILASLQWMETSVTDPSHLSMLQKSQDELRRISGLIQNLLHLSRPTEFSLREIPLARLIGDLVEFHGPVAMKQEVELTFSPPPEPVSLLSDEQALRHILHNLILNALQATPAGGSIHLTLDLVPPDERRRRFPTFTGDQVARLSIADTGVGIPANVLPRIFTPFFTTRPGGTGLGLAVTRDLVYAIGGDLTVKSEPGQGSVFTVLLSSQVCTPCYEAPDRQCASCCETCERKINLHGSFCWNQHAHQPDCPDAHRSECLQCVHFHRNVLVGLPDIAPAPEEAPSAPPNGPE